ncbi:hypothetical protein [Longimicrobium sp.]|uniref:hypothetical protein n=1 Tax=Longimicrobium sp. TaxID=2029185 RepID=UPI002EDA32C7
MSDDAGPADFSAYLRTRRDHADQALIEMFSQVLRRPLIDVRTRDLVQQRRAAREAATPSS